MLSQATSDRYRCPDNFLNFVLRGDLSSDQGYFRFGPNITCYGRSSAGNRGPRPEPYLYDALEDTSVSQGQVTLPFDPTEIIENLRRERYAHSLAGGGEGLLRKLYYLLRPLTNRRIRSQIQKFHARNWREQSFPRWPLDTTVESVCEMLLLLSLQANGVEKVPFVWFWPQGARGCLLMTHDVEAEAGWEFCTELMNIDDSFGIKASFQIVPTERHAVSENVLQTMRNRGFEVAIQDLNHDGRLFDDREEFLRRAKLIRHYANQFGAKGFRAAVLYRKPEWLDDLNFSFDMSVPNIAHLDPQRGGCCTVMPYFIGKTLELPITTTQDYTLFHLLNERSIDLWKSQIDGILEKNGLVSFIVHPDYITEDDTKSVYKQLLGYLRALRERTRIWSALPSEIDAWWRARSQMRLQCAGDSWRIEGEGSERAVLAYAKNADGKLVYELAKAAGAK